MWSPELPKGHGICYHEVKAKEKSKCELTTNTWPGVIIRIVVVIITGVARFTQGSQQHIINIFVGLEANKVANRCVAGLVRCSSGCRNVHHRMPYLAAHLNHDLEANIQYFMVVAPSGILILEVGADTRFQSVRNFRGSSTVFCNSRSEFS